MVVGVGRPLRGVAFRPLDRAGHLLLHGTLDVTPLMGEDQLAVDIRLFDLRANFLHRMTKAAGGPDAMQVAGGQIVQH